MFEDDDRTDDPSFRRWAKAVKVRDNFTCRVCGKRGVYLESHHLNSWDWCTEQRFDLDNGITLCAAHHQKFHEIFDYGNNHEWQFKQYEKIFDILKKIAEKDDKA